MKEVVIVSGARTAIGNFGGSLKDVPLVKLGALVIKEVLKKVGLRPIPSEEMINTYPNKLQDKKKIDLENKYDDWDNSQIPITVDEVIMGNVLQAGHGQNPARQASIYAGIPKDVPAMTINKVCGSGLKAIAIGAMSIMNGFSDVVIAGGFENMSQTPMALPKARWGYRMELTGKGELVDLMVLDGLFEIFYGCHMGVTAENIASLYGITRKEQDELAFLSHTRALSAIRNGLFSEEIVPVIIKTKKGEFLFDTDERPMETSLEKMGKLPAVFKKGGTVTAGNASGINDAAAAVLLMNKEKAKDMGIEPLAKIRAFASGAVDPAYMGLGPIPAVRKVLKATGMNINDIDLIELNEAFAAQALACFRELGIDQNKANELGSGISLGHPIGCTGARIVVTGLYHMKRKNYNTALFSLCIGGGMGMAMIVDR